MFLDPNADRVHIDQKEPLPWLVSLIFTPDFANRQALLSASLKKGPLDPASTEWTNPAKYGTKIEIYNAAEAFVINNEEAMACLVAAQQAVDSKTIRFFTLDADKWGDKPAYEPDKVVDTHDFVIWAENNGYRFSPLIIESLKVVIYHAVNEKQKQEQQEYAFPKITPEQFHMVCQEPLWKMRDALLYVLGRRARGENDNYRDESGLHRKLSSFASDAFHAEQLKLTGYNESLSQAKVVPSHFLDWVQTLPLKLPAFPQKAPPVATESPKHTTPEMHLLLDAVTHFWEPAGASPLKKHVTAWLMEEAQKRNIELSANLADAIDTIIRPETARRGGLKAVKG